MRQEYLIGALVVSIATSIGGAIYSYISGKKISDLEQKLDRKSDDLYRDIERKKDDLMKSVESEVSDLNATLKKKVDGIAESLDVDIPDDIVEAALRKAADTEATAKIAATSRKVMDEYSVSLRTEVRKSVDLAYANTKVDVKNELTKLLKNDREKYEKFFDEFGTSLKFGVYSDYGHKRSRRRGCLFRAIYLEIKSMP